MAVAAEVVRARIDTDLKRRATAVLSEMGLSVSDAIRLLLVRVAADGALPFELRVPNAETQEAMIAIQRGEVISVKSVTELFAALNAED